MKGKLFLSLASSRVKKISYNTNLLSDDQSFCRLVIGTSSHNGRRQGTVRKYIHTVHCQLSDTEF